MQAVQLLGSRRLHLTDAPAPALEPGDALLRVRASGICGSDLHGLYRPDRTAPCIPGHEIVGEVMTSPPGTGLAPGQRVVVFPMALHPRRPPAERLTTQKACLIERERSRAALAAEEEFALHLGHLLLHRPAVSNAQGTSSSGSGNTVGGLRQLWERKLLGSRTA
jgi:threonine dehydrogenase-like Zn-dependent dehydrogenase